MNAFLLQNRYNKENNKYQTLPGKFSRPEQNGVRLPSSSPLQLSPDESEDSEFNLSKQSSHSTHNSSCQNHVTWAVSENNIFSVYNDYFLLEIKL